MTFVRSIGRWAMTALVINCIIGGGIFGLPGELTRLLGRASPFAMILAALGMAVILSCFAEVASQFSEPGGAYLYVRTAFGRFAGMQISWFDMLNMIATVAALANLFVDYLATFLRSPLGSWNRAAIMAILIAIPAAANYRGVRSGANLSSLMTVAKLLPLALLVLFGVARFAHHPEIIHLSEVASPGLSNWVRAMALLLFVFGGWEDSLLPTGEVREPRRTIPFGLGMGLLGCAAIYMLLQFIVVTTIGTNISDAPLPAAASVLLGRGGAAFVTIAALVSIYGWISASMLYAPRLAYSLAAQGDFPSVFTRLHTRFSHTHCCHPIVCIHWLGICVERYFPLAGSSYFRHDDGFICGGLRLPYPSAQAASENRRLQNPIWSCTESYWLCNRPCVDDSTQASRTSFNVRYRADC